MPNEEEAIPENRVLKHVSSFKTFTNYHSLLITKHIIDFIVILPSIQ